MSFQIVLQPFLLHYLLVPPIRSYKSIIPQLKEHSAILFSLELFPLLAIISCKIELMRELALVYVKLDVFSNERLLLLFEDCAKSAADLCIMKVRFGALVDKLDKRTIVKTEIDEAWKIVTKLKEGWRRPPFKRNLRGVTCKQDYQLHENYVGGSILDGIEISLGKTPAFEKESWRVVLEMMKGAKAWEKRGPALDEASALCLEWARAKVDKCLFKVYCRAVVDRHPAFEVLKSEIAEARAMEKQVRDRLVTVLAKAKNSEDGIVMVGGDLRKRLVERLGSFWQNAGPCRVGTIGVSTPVVGIVVVAVAKAKKW